LADTYTIINGHKIRLFDNGDGTFSIVPLDANNKVETATQLTGSNILYAGTKTDVGTTAAAIGGSQKCNEVLVQADPDNSVDVFIGNSTIQPLRLKPGVSATIPVNNVSLIYAKTTSGTATVNWLARS